MPDATSGVVDDAQERLLVVVVYHQAQVGQHVFDFLAPIEREALVDAVGNGSAAEGFLYGTRLHVGAVENSERLVVEVFAEVGFLYRFGYEAPFIALIGGTEQGDAVALGVVGPYLLLYLLDVFGYNGVGGVDDDLGGAVVLFKLEEVQVGVVAAEVEDVLYVGATESVDALGIVAHDADVLQPRGKLFDNEVLRVVGVLVLIDHDVLESVLILEQHIGEVAQEDVHVEEQVVEVHGHGIAQAVVVVLVDFGNHGLV